MLDPADTRFFQFLKEACDAEGGVDQSCRDAVDRAVATGDPVDLRTARDAIDRLDVSLKDSVLQQVHQRMATDLSAIWDVLPGAPDKQRPN
ncbi:MAG: hypothetical protein R8G34_15875 [Paracoccaceae bacterium]|nr:hypothetical protein [Paracoccaceae bacterium]